MLGSSLFGRKWKDQSELRWCSLVLFLFKLKGSDDACACVLVVLTKYWMLQKKCDLRPSENKLNIVMEKLIFLNVKKHYKDLFSIYACQDVQHQSCEKKNGCTRPLVLTVSCDCKYDVQTRVVRFTHLVCSAGRAGTLSKGFALKATLKCLWIKWRWRVRAKKNAMDMYCAACAQDLTEFHNFRYFIP